MGFQKWKGFSQYVCAGTHTFSFFQQQIGASRKFCYEIAIVWSL